MNNQKCDCFEPSARAEWTERSDIGTTPDFWEVSSMRCAKCCTPWLRAFLEHEAFSRSGRHYRAPTTNDVLADLTPGFALDLVKAAAFKIVGGSRFDGAEYLLRGQVKLISSP